MESSSRFSSLIEHDLFGKPLHTFPDHAPARLTRRQARPAAPFRHHKNHLFVGPVIKLDEPSEEPGSLWKISAGTPIICFPIK
jgi:hypothetical protein